MRRLLRRYGVLLASLGLAISTLLVAPMGTAPAQANHITSWDSQRWWHWRDGSWYFIRAQEWCFTVSNQNLTSLYIRNDGSATHAFRARFVNYFDQEYAVSDVFVLDPGESFTWDPGVVQAVSQVNHPRAKVDWFNNSGHWALLWDLNPWDAFNDPDEGKQPKGSTSNCNRG